MKLNQITTAQAMSHPDVVLTINTLGKMADELRAQNQALLEALKAFVNHGTCSDDEDIAMARAAIKLAEGKDV